MSSSCSNKFASIPPLYAKWLENVIPDTPDEPLSDCNNCPFVKSKFDYGKDWIGELQFNKDTKCCTYMPTIPNFSVGRILNDPNTHPHGKQSTEERITARAGVTPLGLGRTELYKEIYQKSPGAFGKAKSMRCPHYVEEGGLCGVWQNREATCFTFFCKSTRAEVGRAFWQNSLRALFETVEAELSQWAVVQLAPGTESLSFLLRREHNHDRFLHWDQNHVEKTVQDEVYAEIWGRWQGKEIEFYKKCASLVDALSWDDILKICGPKVGAYVITTQETYKKLAIKEIPENILLGRFLVLRQDGDKLVLQSPLWPYEYPELPSDIFNVLNRFDGRKTQIIREEILKKDCLKIDDETIIRLLDHKILLPA